MLASSQFLKHDSHSSAAGPLHVLCMEASSARGIVSSLILFLSLLERHLTRESLDYRALSPPSVFNTLLCFIFFMALNTPRNVTHLFACCLIFLSPQPLYAPVFRKASVSLFTDKAQKVRTIPSSLQAQHHSISFE